MTEERTREHLAPATVDAPRIVIIGVVVLSFLGASMGVLAFIFFLVTPANRVPAASEFPQPQLQAHPAGELQRLLAKQHNELRGYRWANSDHTLVAIPIERAMEIIAARAANGYQPIEPSHAASSPPSPGVKP